MSEPSTERMHADFQASLANLFAALVWADQPPSTPPAAGTPASDKHHA